MTPSTHTPGASRGPRRSPAVLCLLAVATGAVLVAVAGSAAAAATPVGLGTAGSFAVLAGSGITNTGTTVVDGDVGTFPTTTLTGGATLLVNGVDHGGDAVTQQAKQDLQAAYDDAASQGPVNPVVADLGGQRLAPGVHGSATSLGLTGALTLDAAGDPSAVFVLQAGSTLTTASASSVVLAGGAQACNVFWQVGSSATLGTASTLTGSVLALESITLTTGAAVEGRLLARGGAVVLDGNRITRPSCATTGAGPGESPAAGDPSPAAGGASPAASPAAGGASPGPASPAVTPTPTAGPTPGSPPPAGGPQVPVVPTGPVAAGSSSALRSGTLPAAAAVLALGLAGALHARRRTS